MCSYRLWKNQLNSLFSRKGISPDHAKALVRDKDGKLIGLANIKVPTSESPEIIPFNVPSASPYTIEVQENGNNPTDAKVSVTDKDGNLVPATIVQKPTWGNCFWTSKPYNQENDVLYLLKLLSSYFLTKKRGP
eukprot:TRINITY_DN12796_c0_g1_i7.p1 TRINITY_DN12796_c0_g1~~TRINITY_DN12796_c0_g1_i7.p1  ORF type:complete len:134 (-),score=29.37 TRINITY_DN12796_c0_g1_i7:291-692(-)